VTGDPQAKFLRRLFFSALALLCNSFTCSSASIRCELDRTELERPVPEGVLDKVKGPGEVGGWMDQALVDAELRALFAMTRELRLHLGEAGK
jgi:hypothetical protein